MSIVKAVFVLQENKQISTLNNNIWLGLDQGLLQ